MEDNRLIKKPKIINTTNLKRIIIHLAKFTDEVDLNLVKKQPFTYKDQIIKTWKFQWTDYEDSHCPCGMSISERCWLLNVKNGKTEFIGNVCVGNFNNELKGIVKVVETLNRGIVGTVTQVCCNHIHFKLKTSKNNLITYKKHLENHFGQIPLECISEDPKRYELKIKNPDKLRVVVNNDTIKHRITLKMINHPTKDKCVFNLKTVKVYDEDELKLEEDLKLFLQDEKENNYSVKIKIMIITWTEKNLHNIQTTSDAKRDYLYFTGNESYYIKDQITITFPLRKWNNDFKAWKIPYKWKTKSLLDIRKWITNAFINVNRKFVY